MQEIAYMQRNYTKRNPTGIVNKSIFLLFAMPLGILYFTLVVVGLSVGLGTFIIWIGIPILFATMAAIQGLAALERAMASSMLDVYIPVRRQRYGPRTMQQRFKDYLRDPLTWKSLAYMLFIKLPLGIFTFTVVITFLIVALSFLLMPLVYLLLTFIYNAVGSHDPHWNLIGANTWAYIRITGEYNIIDFIKAFALTAIGIPLWWLTARVIDGTATLSATIIRVMLGSEDAVQSAYPYAQDAHVNQPPQPVRYNEGYQGMARQPQSYGDVPQNYNRPQNAEYTQQQRERYPEQEQQM